MGSRKFEMINAETGGGQISPKHPSNFAVLTQNFFNAIIFLDVYHKFILCVINDVIFKIEFPKSSVLDVCWILFNEEIISTHLGD